MTQNQTKNLSLVEPEQHQPPVDMSSRPSGVLPARDEWNIYVAMAKNLARTPFGGDGLGGEPGIVSIMLYARELGVPPMTAVMGGFSNVRGHLEMGSRLINLRIRQLGHKISIKELDEEKCSLHFKRADTGEEGDVTYTIAMAEAAGLVKPDSNWMKHRQDMLFARAITRVGRRHIPEAVGMAYVEGEIVEAFSAVHQGVPKAVQGEVIEPDNGSGSGNGSAGGNGGSGDNGEDDPSRGRDDDLRHPGESIKLSEFTRRINAQIEKKLGPVELSEDQKKRIWNLVEEFVLQVAKGNDSTEDDVKMNVVSGEESWTDFMGYLIPRLGPVFDAIAKELGVTVRDEEKGDPGSKTVKTGSEELDPVALMRQEFIKLTKVGLPTFVWKNIERIRKDFPEHLIQELREKWNKLIPDAPFPLDKKKEETKTTTGNGATTIFCTQKGTRVYPSVCEQKCEKRGTCEDYRKFKGEEIPGTNDSGEPEDDDDFIYCSQYGRKRPLFECKEGCPLEPNRCKAYMDRLK